jgi:hypothetical protein
VLREERHRPGDEIVEVHGALRRERALVPRVHLARDEIVVVALPRLPHPDLPAPLVLGARHEREDAVRVEGAIVHLHLAHAALHEGDLVPRVADGEAPRQAGRLVLLVEEPQAEAVEGGDEHVRPGGAGERRHPLAHLARGLVRERDGEDRLGIGALHHQPRDAVRDDARLARPGAGQHQERPLEGGDGLALWRVQRREVEHGGASMARRRARDKS